MVAEIILTYLQIMFLRKDDSYKREIKKTSTVESPEQGDFSIAKYWVKANSIIFSISYTCLGGK